MTTTLQAQHEAAVAAYTDRTKALRKQADAMACKGCGKTFDGTERFFGYGDDAECESCALGSDEA